MNEETEPDDGGAETPERLRRLASRALGRAAAQADRIITEGLAEADAHRWHYAVLATLAEFGPASQATLSRRTGVHRSDMVGVLNTLAARGLVERAPNPADRRRNVITLTPEGSARLADLDALQTTLQDRVLAPLSPADRALLHTLLDRLTAHHGQAGQPPWPA
ncbi:MarR family transcriptional regulator [Actinocorallia sp. API 0066]|uniref:MarR family winged helix-turn-helix transcriptional regulator n=1 Tax=Actinocorallia sp. API 0066 TaxID=2896846 RepID=UPI001E3ACC07|nr:MarR family transcriptional regulator [Actinocorallia sp. API 0066]MCD0449515.1 MarR family transcriptional regulator [Actinocorallia sp. API 0066]